MSNQRLAQLYFFLYTELLNLAVVVIHHVSSYHFDLNKNAQTTEFFLQLMFDMAVWHPIKSFLKELREGSTYEG